MVVGQMSDSHRDLIDAAAHVLGLMIEPAWKPAIEANLAVDSAACRLVHGISAAG